MARNSSGTRKKRAKRSKRGFLLVHWRRIVIAGALIALLSVSLCALGYVVFFRSVFAQEIMVNLREAIVFEEPDPPTVQPGRERARIEIHRLPVVAIIIDDMGYQLTLGEEFLAQNIVLSFSFLPYAPFTRQLAELAHEQGKTVLLHLPLEPKGEHWYPGPGTIYLHDANNAKQQKFLADLAEVPYAEGVNTHMGSRFTESYDGMMVIMQQVAAKGLFFVDSFTTAASVGYKLAKEMQITSGRRQVFLDNNLEEMQICEQLSELVSAAEKQGQAIGIAHPHRETLDALRQCAPAYERRVTFVGINETL
jgi:polysaccharide deacetylase 2 family uncharacterized protein YibQ